MPHAVVGVDVGTTGVKAVLVGGLEESFGRVLAEASEEYPTRFVGAGGAEQDPGDWWNATVRCVREILSSTGVSASDIAGVGVSAQAPSVVVVDRTGAPVRPALLWMDRRGYAECARRADAASDTLERTGNRLDPYFAAPTLAWLLNAEPDVRRTGDRVLMANGYVVRQLTGVSSCDTGHVGLTLLGDLDTASWQPDLLALWGIPATWLPDPTAPTNVVGQLKTEAAEACGLRAGTPVVTGLVDGAAASLAAGLAGHGDVSEMTGQSTVLNAPFDSTRLRRDALGGLSVLPYPIDGHHLVFGAMVSTGGILRWFRDELADGATYDELDRLAATARPGAGGLVMLPYFLGERAPIWNTEARGAIVGLSMTTRRADLVRACYEGTAYGLAHNLEELARIGLAPKAIRSVGGGSRGRTWNQVKADVTGLRIDVPDESHGAPLGAALVAAAGVGLVDDLPAAVRERGRTATSVEPDPERHATYRRYYAVYRELYPALRPSYAKLAELRDDTLDDIDGR